MMVPSKRTIRLGLTLSGLLLLGACQHLPDGISSLPFMHSSKSDATDIAGPLPPPADRTWPSDSHDVINQKAQGYGLVHMPAMQRYLDGLLTRIKDAAGVPEWPGHVYVLAAAGLEATASGAGNVYVSQAWLSSAESEDEIVALLSHEFAHVYLHYDKLNDVLPASDTAARVLAVGAALAIGSSNLQGWSPVDTGLLSYTAARKLLSTAWSRSQESDADILGANLALKLGYSYEAGFKTLLERLATWEEQRAKQEKVAARQLAESIKATAIENYKQRHQADGTGIATQKTNEAFANLTGFLQGGSHQVSKNLDDLWGSVTSSHPDLVGRLDRLSAAADELPKHMLKDEATQASWLKALKDRHTASILKNHALAFQVLEHPDNPEALAWARQSARGDTSTDALPLFALYIAQKAHGRMPADKASTVLTRNFASTKDRAWITYAERSKALADAGHRQQAQQVLAQGFQLFQDAGSVWPYFIGSVGQNGDWPQAKNLAQECSTRFPHEKQACSQAALTPSERAQADQQNEAKAKSLVDKLLPFQ